MTDFIFRLDSFHLTQEQTNHIAAAVQGAVMTELARLDLHAHKPAAAGAGGSESAMAASGGSGTFAHFPKLWNGGWLLKDLGALQNATKQILGVKASPAGGG